MTNDEDRCPECGGNYPMHEMNCVTGQAKAIINAASKNNRERAAFEEWADLSSRQAWRGNDGAYKNSDIQAKWEVWKARAAVAPVLWKFTGPAGLKRVLTDSQYQAQTYGVKKWYEPMCAKCHEAAPVAK